MPQWTQVNVECPDCGASRISVRELTVSVCVDDERSSYCFRCPTCGRANAHQLDPQAVSLLVVHGARLQRWRLPAELGEPHAVDPPFTPDDLLDFHLLLQTADWLETCLVFA